MISRRSFLKTSGGIVLTYGTIPLLLQEMGWALPAPTGKKVLVVIFQRGAMDGLSMVPPLGDANYFSARPNIALKTTDEKPVISLDGYFGLHPSLDALKPFWDNSSLAFVHEVGSPDPTRSHFDAQDYLEIGTPGNKNTPDGFLNRAASNLGNKSSMLAVALQPSMPRSLQGKFPAISLNSMHDFGMDRRYATEKESQGFEAMYKQAADHVFRGVGQEVFNAIHSVGATAQEKANKKGNKKALGKRLYEIAQLIKGNLGVQIAVTEMGGWDTHVNQGNFKGQLANHFQELGEGLADFATELGPLFNDVCVVTITEFGRTVKENGNRGTDHGHGSVAMVLGGSVRGKKVHGNYRELHKDNLFEGRDIPVTTDFRELFAEVLQHHLGVTNLTKVFPSYPFDPKKRVGVLKT